MIREGIACHLDDPLTNVSFGIDWLQGHHHITLLNALGPEFVEYAVYNEYGVLRDSGLHGFARSGANGEDLRVEEVECGDGGEHHEAL